MKIAGIQKLTLIDYPGKLACTLFFYGCNLRCGFCHNPELVIEPLGRIYSEKEVLDFLKDRKKYLDGVCITGGEPLLDIDKTFLRKIKEFGYDIKIDTNGCFPDAIKELVEENLVNYIAMDIKSGKDNYERVVGKNIDIDKIEKSIKLICDFGAYEFRTTIVEGFHDEEEIKKIGEWLNNLCGRKPSKYFLQGFKNNQKFIDNSYKFKRDISEEYLRRLMHIALDYFENVGIR